MKKCILYTYVFFLATMTMAQDYIAPSPDAMGMIRQASAQVSHYTGSLAMSIPLAELRGRELSISASLSYNPASNRVHDIAGSEGLGWSLSAGGMISRIVRGLPDDLTNGYCTAGRTDPEPDLFVFNFMGRSGKFVLDANGSPTLYPYQDLLIKPGICQTTAQTWEIVDENGVRYHFGADSQSQETTTTRPLTGSVSTSYVSTWYLSSVDSPNGTDRITLSYGPSTISYTNYYFTKEDGCVASTAVKDESSQVTVHTRTLSSISSKAGYMSFSWLNTREDLTGGRALQSVTVRNLGSVEMRKLSFQYGYFNATAGCNTQLCKRLRLERIYDFSPEPLYEFVYNTTVNLPTRDSKNFDHWGYYNSNTVDSWIPAHSPLGYSGASRTPDETRMQANLLTRINERSGGYQIFTYEANRGIKNGQTYIISGARIKSLQTGDGRGNVYTTNYAYTKSGSTETSGLLFRLPSYTVSVTTPSGALATKRFSHAYSEVLDLNGASLGYSRVEESSPGSGKVVYTFTNYDTNPDQTLSGNAAADSPPFASVSSLFWERGNPKIVTTYNEQNQPLLEESFEYTFNHPNKKQTNGTRSIRVDHQGCGSSGYASFSSTYTIFSRPFTLKQKITKVYDQDNTGQYTTSVIDYGYDTDTYQLTSVTRYNAAVPAEKYITILKYITHNDYDFDQYALCKAELDQCFIACGDNRTTCHADCQATYTTCLKNTAGSEENATIRLTRTRHMHNLLVEEQQLIERNLVKKLTSAQLNRYKRQSDNLNIIQLATTSISDKVSGTFRGSFINDLGDFIVPGSFKTVQTYNTHDAATGQLLQQTARDGIVTQYVWRSQTTGGDDKTVLQSVTLKGDTKQRTTSYDQNEQKRLYWGTDPNGRVTYREFDAAGRLRLVKDHNSDIRERYRYNYSGETPSFKLSADRLQAKVGESIWIQVSDVFAPNGVAGEMQWDYGDGRVFSGQPFPYVSYSATGTYIVKVTLFANEYPPVTRSLQIIIN